MNPIFDIVIRSVTIYVFILIAIRLVGKKEISQLSIADLVLILLISNSVQNAMVGPDTSLIGGITAASALFLLNYLLKWIMFRSPKISAFIEGDEVMLIYKGNVIEEAMSKQKITLDELKAVVREHGVNELKDVELAILERNGSISVVSKDFTGQSYHKRKKGLHPKLGQID